jgi:hypothetical protein
VKEPKTIKQYIKIMRMFDKLSISDLKGFEILNEEYKSILIELSGEISNKINEISI